MHDGPQSSEDIARDGKEAMNTDSPSNAGGDAPPSDNALAYQEAAASARHHDTLMWSMIGISLVAQGALFGFIFSQAHALPTLISVISSILGLIVALATIYLCISFRAYKRVFYEIARRHEEQLSVFVHRDPRVHRDSGGANQELARAPARPTCDHDLPTDFHQWDVVSSILHLLGLLWIACLAGHLLKCFRIC